MPHPFYSPPALAPGDARLVAGPAGRNRGPILDVLRRFLPSGPRDGATPALLEIGSGTGQHVVHFAAALPHVRFLPTDIDAAYRASIAAWVQHEGLSNVAAPQALDVTTRPWPVAPVDVVLATNVVHVVPVPVMHALLAGAAGAVVPGGHVILYGPYLEDGRHVADSNVAFDASLRAADPAWGVRDVADVVAAGAAAGLRLVEVVPMPANNRMIVLQR